MSNAGLVNCPFCGDVTRLIARVIYPDPKTGKTAHANVLFCNVTDEHFVLYYYCARHRVHLEPLRGPEPPPAAEG